MSCSFHQSSSTSGLVGITRMFLLILGGGSSEVGGAAADG